MTRRAFSFRVTLSQVGPLDPDFRAAPATVRAEVLRWLVVYGLKEKDADLAKGLDKEGEPLAPIAEKTEENRESEMGPADPNAPPLMPAYAVSRTRLLLEGAPTERGDAVEFFWAYDPFTGGSWGQILDYQRRGIGKRKVKRDVIGISDEALLRIRDQIDARWRAWKRAGLAVGWKPPPKPIPKPAPLTVRGRTDFESFTYGIGGPGGAAASRQALAVGGSTGFFQRRPGAGWTAYGGPEGGGRPRPWEPEPPLPPPRPRRPRPVAPKPKPPPPAPPPPAVVKPAPKPKPKPVPPLTPTAPQAFTPPPTPLLPPSTARGVPVSDALAVKVTGKLAADVRDTIRAIGRVHGTVKLPKIPIEEITAKGSEGQFSRDSNPHYDPLDPNSKKYIPSKIEVKATASEKRMTMAHEFGHYLDRFAIPGTDDDNERLWSIDPTMKDWYAAAKASAAVKTLEAQHAASTYKDYYDYLLRPTEIWARSYEQYITMKSGDAEMQAELQQVLAKQNAPSVVNPVPQYWTEAEFEPIALAIDKLMKGLGWMQ